MLKVATLHEAHRDDLPLIVDSTLSMLFPHLLSHRQPISTPHSTTYYVSSRRPY